jgi:hypothetical protein
MELDNGGEIEWYLTEIVDVIVPPLCNGVRLGGNAYVPDMIRRKG